MGSEHPADEASELWRRARPVLRETLGEQPYRTYIVPIVPFSANAERVVLGCPTAEHRHRTILRCGTTIADVLAYLSRLERKVDFVVGPEARLAAERPADLWDGDATLPVAPLVQGSGEIERRSTLRNFVKGRTNEVAAQAAEAFADGAGVRREPLVLCGPTGCGKSHLLAAIAWRVLEHDPGKRVLWIGAEALLEKYLSAEGDLRAFREMLCDLDVFICDDLDGLAGKPSTPAIQAFFTHLEEAIAGAARAVVGGSVLPALMEHLPDGLKSRLARGQVAEMFAADLDLRVAIVREATRRRGHELPGFAACEQVLHLIAGNLEGDARVLLGALKRLEVRWLADRAEITIEVARACLSDFFRAHKKQANLGEIKLRVAAFYRIKLSDLEGRCREQAFVRARHIGYYLSRTMTQRSFPEIGRAYCRDHTTVMHGYDRISRRRVVDPDLDAEIEAIKRAIRERAGDPKKNTFFN